MKQTLLIVLWTIVMTQAAMGAVSRVPADHKSIQGAIDASSPGDTILVAPGNYLERLRLTPGITLRSDGDDAKGTFGLARAQATVIDGGGKEADRPGVLMAEGSTLDGFTVTRVGVYDQALWQKHFDSHGEELGDDEGSVQAEGTFPAISIQGVSCKVIQCIVHHNGDVGIAVLGKEGMKAEAFVTGNAVFRNMGGGIGVAEGAEPVIRANRCHENLRAGIGCRKANPVITENVCYGNVRAGIGCREGAKPVIRGNKCYQNRRAGIGIRMVGTAPVVDANECFENAMAGIGCRDGASPILRSNICNRNKMAGIGCDGATPLIVGNECRENALVGIGVQDKSMAVIQGNKLVDNTLVAIGVHGASNATIADNELSRTGGMPPLIMVKEGSAVSIRDNRIVGGGVAAILMQGQATITGNTFTGTGKGQGNGVWVLNGSVSTISDNAFDGYRTAVNAAKASVTVTGNSIRHFQQTAIIVKESQKPAILFGNTAYSDDPKAKATEVQGPSGVVQENALKMP